MLCSLAVVCVVLCRVVAVAVVVVVVASTAGHCMFLFASGWKTARVVVLLFQYGGRVGWGGVGY